MVAGALSEIGLTAPAHSNHGVVAIAVIAVTLVLLLLLLTAVVV
jgi:hypothetical protein